MEIKTVIFIVSNIVVPIIVAVVTGAFQAKKYKKEIELLNVTHENRIKELTGEYDHKIEILELQHKHAQELENQKTENAIVEMLSDKLGDQLMKQPATQKMINHQATKGFLSKKRR